MRSGHEPVLVDEVVRLVAGGSGTYLDATVGGGGHAEAMLRALPADARLLGLDRDPGAIAVSRERLREFGDRVVLVSKPFDQLGEVMSALGLRSLAGALFDLGLSSLQLVDDSRGFSFRAGGMLDLRFDPTSGRSAREVLETIDEPTLARVLFEYGELKDARKVARALIEARDRRGLATTDDVRAAITAAWGPRPEPRRMAQLFQALRILVNDELGRLDRALQEVPERLAFGAALAVISYHSLEDRRVKALFRGPKLSRRETRLGAVASETWDILTPRPLRPTPLEVAKNPRARSARLRAAVRRKAA
ncbi:MAG TPA: 16S rRNA (cytosine(1402)-N(4))-methyltransferase RsmH [Candidatus Eisenbacteria bacterium]|nr:16S rRNA (cytosine(1402)-N(4))-methyltransferase RsmH [Candidatus Eisenbacteria bacterium]